MDVPVHFRFLKHEEVKYLKYIIHYLIYEEVLGTIMYIIRTFCTYSSIYLQKCSDLGPFSFGFDHLRISPKIFGDFRKLRDFKVFLDSVKVYIKILS